jgi:hypothetical protein
MALSAAAFGERERISLSSEGKSAGVSVFPGGFDSLGTRADRRADNFPENKL